MVLQQDFAYGDNVNEQLLDLLDGMSGRVLDVGCGTGFWEPLLRQRGAGFLAGIEPSVHAAPIAAERYDILSTAPLESTGIEQLGGETFDWVIAADVLEHLVDPWMALRMFHRISSPGAHLAISMPNLQYYAISMGAVFGRFNYRVSGPMDWTHLRWFTKRSLERSLLITGWKPVEWAWPDEGKRGLLIRGSRSGLGPLLAKQLKVRAVRLD